MRVLYWEDQKAIDRVELILRSGKVVVGTSDTVLGLLAELSEQGVRSLDAIKKRSGKPYLVLIAQVDVALEWITPNKKLQIERLMHICWPGPVTLICKAKDEVPACMKSKDGTIALRVPDHKGLQQLLKRFINGLFSTSANSSGKPIPRTINELDSHIQQQVALIITTTKKTDKKTPYLPSTILDCSEDQITVVREGAYPTHQIEEQFGKSLKRV